MGSWTKAGQAAVFACIQAMSVENTVDMAGLMSARKSTERL